MVHGNVLISILNLIIDEIDGGTFGSGGIYSLPALKKTAQARAKLKDLTSVKYLMKK